MVIILPLDWTDLYFDTYNTVFTKISKKIDFYHLYSLCLGFSEKHDATHVIDAMCDDLHYALSHQSSDLVLYDPENEQLEEFIGELIIETKLQTDKYIGKDFEDFNFLGACSTRRICFIDAYWHTN